MANSLRPRDPKRINLVPRAFPLKAGNALAARNNETYEQGNGRQSFCTVLRYHEKLLDTGILFLAVFTLELEMDCPVYSRALHTDTHSPIFSEGTGRL